MKDEDEYEVVPLDDPKFIEFQERRNKIPMTLKDLIEQELERDKNDK